MQPFWLRDEPRERAKEATKGGACPSSSDWTKKGLAFATSLYWSKKVLLASGYYFEDVSIILKPRKTTSIFNEKFDLISKRSKRSQNQELDPNRYRLSERITTLNLPSSSFWLGKIDHMMSDLVDFWLRSQAVTLVSLLLQFVLKRFLYFSVAQNFCDCTNFVQEFI